MLRCIAPLALVFLSACGGSTATTPVTYPVVAQTRISSGAETAPDDALSGAPTAIAAAAASPADSAGVSFGSLLNGVRTTAGVGSVSHDSRLGNAAQTYAADMLSENRFSHIGSDGSTVGKRATAAGYNWRSIGENIAQGYTSEQGVLDAWQDSPGHRENNLAPAFKDFGLGVAGSGSQTRWVLMLALER